MRCLALAQEFRRAGARVRFACTQSARGFIDRLTAADIGYMDIEAEPGGKPDAAATIELARGLVVLDGYRFDGGYQEAIRNAGFRTLIIDDEALLDRYHADFILNQNLNATAAMYEGRAPGAKLLLGAQYVLLRDEVRAARVQPRPIPARATKLLLSLGGSDPLNLTGKLSGRLTDAGFEVTATAGADDMGALMAAADIAVISAGATLWEAAYMGLPSIAVVVADNQLGSAKWAESNGRGPMFDAREGLSLDAVVESVQEIAADAGSRHGFSSRGMALIDGDGCARVRAAIDQPTAITLRPATLGDARLLFEWRNDPVTREQSIETGRVTWDSHLEWLKETLDNGDRMLFVAERSTAAVGTVRADREAGSWVLSWSVAPEARGQGVGTTIVAAAVRQLTGPIEAEIKHGNIASEKIARAAGMERVSDQDGISHWRLRE